jgi:hypothetical protein
MQDVVTRDGQPHTVDLATDFPNFGAIEHWPELIWYIGPAWLQSTNLWEHQHLDCKLCAQNTNKKETERDVLKHVCLCFPSFVAARTSWSVCVVWWVGVITLLCFACMQMG